MSSKGTVKNSGENVAVTKVDLFFVLVYGIFDGDANSDTYDRKDDEDDEETYPSLFASRSGGHHGCFGVFQSVNERFVSTIPRLAGRRRIPTRGPRPFQRSRRVSE